MKKHKYYSKQGFTIIEVVLVLAIAGLIFLMVFIALPALQRAQRNQSYKNNVALVAGAINNYKANNRGSLPPTTTRAHNDGYYPKRGNNDAFKEHPMYSYFEAINFTADVDSIKIFNENTDNFKFNNTWWAAPSRIIVMENMACPENNTFRTAVMRRSPGKIAVFTLLENGDNRHPSQADFPMYCNEI